MTEGKNIGTFKGHRGAIQSLCKLDFNIMASGGDDKKIKLWNFDVKLKINKF